MTSCFVKGLSSLSKQQLKKRKLDEKANERRKHVSVLIISSLGERNRKYALEAFKLRRVGDLNKENNVQRLNNQDADDATSMRYMKSDLYHQKAQDHADTAATEISEQQHISSGLFPLI